MYRAYIKFICIFVQLIDTLNISKMVNLYGF
jgi:hypothetical protein